MKRTTVDVVIDIRKAAYMFGTGKYTLAEIAVIMKRSRRTLSRWRKSAIWKEQIELMKKEG